MRDSWSCLLVEDGPGMLSDEVCAALKMAACRLHLERKDRTQLFTEVLDGVIETEWKTYPVGARSGVLFHAHVDCKDGIDFKVNFLLNMDDLKRGADFLRQLEEQTETPWGISSAPFPLSALYQFRDLRQGASRTMH